MLDILFKNLFFHITCSTVYFTMYVINCYVFKNRKARLPYKVMLTGLLPFLNVASMLLQICFLVPSIHYVLGKVRLSRKIDKAVNELGFTKKANSNNTKVPKRA